MFINGVHLGADKSWGLENFFELAKILDKEYNAKIFFVGIIDCEKMFRKIAPDF